MTVVELAVVAEWLGAARRVVVLTGAGISTESGIPDFRGPDGVWTRDPGAERRSAIDAYLRDGALRERVWQERLHHPAWTAVPNAGHLALAELERLGHLELLVTQNIDGLHLLAGSSPQRVIEIHGTLRQVTCLSCGRRAPMETALARVRAGEADPRCLDCGGLLKSATVSFGQPLVAADLHRAEAAAQACDCFWAVGTSLAVHPVARLPALARRAGARLVLVNQQPTPYDRVADAVMREPIGTVLPAVVRRLSRSRQPS